MIKTITISKAGTPLTVKIERKDACEATITFKGNFWFSRLNENKLIEDLKIIINRYEI